jgi:6-phosphogluconolactonase
MGEAAQQNPNVEVLCEGEAFARRCVELFVNDANEAIKNQDIFYVAISGGNTPRHFFELLSESEQAKALPWKKIHLFWVDERYVPPTSKWSNYKLAADTFLSKVSIEPQNIHRIPTEYSDFDFAAGCYEKAIRKVFRLRKKQMPQFDLIILGMGVEGHTASLFPGSYAALDTESLASVVYVEKLSRITLTYPVLRAACHLVVLVSGENKANILKKVFTSEPDEVLYPIHALWPVLDKVDWLVDTKAAKFLQ